MIVVDASAVGAFLIPDEAGAFATFARDLCAREPLCAPAHWPFEVASLIRKAQRRGRLSVDQSRAAAVAADGLATNLMLADTPPIAGLAMESDELGLTVYDVAYLLLARRCHAPLLTEDAALARVASANGVRVLAP